MTGTIIKKTVKCLICGKEVGRINHLHLRSHKMTTDEYKNLFPDTKLTSDDVRIRVNEHRLVLKGENHPNFGTRWSKERKKEYSEKYRGENGTFYGKHHTEESKRKISENRRKTSKENHPRWIPRVIKNCNECGNEYDVEQRLIDESYYCSKACRFLHDSNAYKNENNPNWRGGISPERQCLYSSKSWKEIKNEVEEIADNKCERCGKELDGKTRFLIHHIIPFEVKEFRTDIDNLVFLCNKCHYWIHSKKNTILEFIKGGTV